MNLQAGSGWERIGLSVGVIIGCVISGKVAIETSTEQLLLFNKGGIYS